MKNSIHYWKKNLIPAFSVSIILTSLINPFAYSAEEQKMVGFGGIYTAGSVGNVENFPNFLRNKAKIISNFRNVLEELNNSNKLSFKLTFETDTEEIKKIVNENPYSLAVIITRDDITNEVFENREQGIFLNKTYINAGIVVVIYQTVEDMSLKGSKKNSIIFSLPLVGYSIKLSGKNELSPEQLDDEFVKVAKTTLEEELAKRLQNISIDEIEGQITEIRENTVIINLGSSDGLSKGQNINVIQDGKKINTGRVEQLDLKEATISFKNDFEKVINGLSVKATNIKGLSNETYQVIDLKISSGKFSKIFSSEIIRSQIGQWFSDFLSERGGKVVFPSRIGNTWIESSNEQSYAVFVKDGQEHLFEVSKPKYGIYLDITGLSSKKIEEESNNVNENWVYKLWLKVDIPERAYSHEFDAVSAKSIIVGTQSFEEKNEIFELLHQITAKSAKEIN